MVLKKCAVCGREFNAIGNDITCGKKCSKIRKNKYDYDYNKEYYRKNWMKWREYAKNRKKDVVGTSNLYGKMHRNSEGDADFDGESQLIKKEMVRLGLLYSK